MRATEGAKSPQPFNGYIFKILTKQGNTAKGGARDYMVNGLLTGGFAVLAYPAEYRNSGLMTFMVGSDGVVYQKDLGEGTSTRCARDHRVRPGRRVDERSRNLDDLRVEASRRHRGQRDTSVGLLLRFLGVIEETQLLARIRLVRQVRDADRVRARRTDP